MPINHFWQGLPPKIDAVYENSEGKFVFFKGNIKYIFVNWIAGNWSKMIDFFCCKQKSKHFAVDL